MSSHRMPVAPTTTAHTAQSGPSGSYGLHQTAMSTASVPTGASTGTVPGSATDLSYRVHLSSLQDFARELETQIDGLAAPTEGLARVGSTPLALGAFGEAGDLVAAQQQAVQQMLALLADVRQAIGFAIEVTQTVSAGYSHADSTVAGGLGSSHGSLGAVTTPVTAALTGAAGQTLGGVGQITGDLGQVVDGVTQGVGQTVNVVLDSVGTVAKDATQALTAIPTAILGGL